MPVQDKPYIHIGYSACPSCGAVCTAHTILIGRISREDWRSETLQYYCGKCKSAFQKQGDDDRWLDEEFKEPS